MNLLIDPEEEQSPSLRSLSIDAPRNHKPTKVKLNIKKPKKSVFDEKTFR